MNGITACFTGHVGKDCEARVTRDGKPWLSFSVAVDLSGQSSVWVKVALFGDTVADLAPRILKGTMVYCEGRLRLSSWTGQDGVERTGLSLAAWTAQPMGQIGRQRPKAQHRLRDEQHRAEAVPFNDAIPF